MATSVQEHVPATVPQPPPAPRGASAARYVRGDAAQRALHRGLARDRGAGAGQLLRQQGAFAAHHAGHGDRFGVGHPGCDAGAHRPAVRAEHDRLDRAEHDRDAGRRRQCHRTEHDRYTGLHDPRGYAGGARPGARNRGQLADAGVPRPHPDRQRPGTRGHAARCQPAVPGSPQPQGARRTLLRRRGRDHARQGRGRDRADGAGSLRQLRPARSATA